MLKTKIFIYTSLLIISSVVLFHSAVGLVVGMLYLDFFGLSFKDWYIIIRIILTPISLFFVFFTHKKLKKSIKEYKK